jgi:hypothetical protein
MHDKPFDSRARLEKARADLAVAARALAQLETDKADASRSPKAFETWCALHRVTSAERERLTILIQLLENEAASADKDAAEDDLRRRYGEKLIANAELAKRIRNDLEKANTILLALVHDVAKSAMEDQTINASLPDDLEPLIAADFQARARPALPREHISRERVWLWTRTDNGAIVGDQDSVEDRGEGKGVIHLRSGSPIRCHQMLFEQVSDHPAEPGERPVPLWQLRLPRANGPGLEYNGEDLRHPREVMVALEHASRASERRARAIETEISPLGAASQDDLVASERTNEPIAETRS